MEKAIGCKCGNNSLLDGVIQCKSCLKWWHKKCIKQSISNTSRDFICTDCSQNSDSEEANEAQDEISDLTREFNLKMKPNTLSKKNVNREKRNDTRNSVASNNAATDQDSNVSSAYFTPLSHFSNDQLRNEGEINHESNPPTSNDAQNAAVSILREIQRLYEEARRERERNERQINELLLKLNQLYPSAMGQQQTSTPNMNNPSTDNHQQTESATNYPLHRDSTFSNSVNDMPNRRQQQNSAVNVNQLVQELRAASSRDQGLDQLPRFDGKDVQEWIRFEAIYNHQKRSGLSRDKLISNLSVALCGEAHDLVAEHLLFREDPDVIVTELANYYGDADSVINLLTQRVVNAVAPREQPKHLLIKFAVHVKRLVTTIMYFGKQDQLNSIYIERNIVSKLRDEHKDMWGEVKRDLPHANLEHLSRFLLERAKDFSAQPPDNRERRVNEDKVSRSIHFIDSRDEKDFSTEVLQKEETNRTSLVAFNDGSSNENWNRTLKCFDCGGSHWLVTCKIFLNRSVDDREKLVNKLRLCGACLSSTDHQTSSCEKRRNCAIPMCNLQHHWLLHKSTL